LVSGSLRRASTNSALLRTLAQLVPQGSTSHLYNRLGDLPAFNPDEDRHPLPLAVHQLRDFIHQADAIVFSTPEYAGALPGSLKNLLDWTIGDDQIGSIYEKPVGWVNASLRSAEGAHRELRTVLVYAHAQVVDSACIHLPVAPTMIGPDGLIQEDTARATLRVVLDELAAATISTLSRDSL
jgi:NAD(P)H-dependent FMN reductase